MKFKVGDKVVRIKRDEDNGRLTSSEYDEGESFTITEIKPWSVIWGDRAVGMYPEDLELESVYNSKLYKALK